MIHIKIDQDGVTLHVNARLSWKMHDISEAGELKKMLEANSDLDPTTIFIEWLRFKFPRPHGRTREERMQRSSSQQLLLI